MLGFVLQGARLNEAALTKTVKIAVQEIATRCEGDLLKAESAKRDHETIALALRSALTGKTPPRLLLSLRTDTKEYQQIPLGQTLNRAGGAVHFLQIGEQVFPICAADEGNRKTEIQLYPPIDLEDFEEGKEKFLTEGFRTFYEKKRSEVDNILLGRDAPPSTWVSFNGGKVHQNEAYAWALWEAAASALRRGYTVALREAGMVDAIEPSKKLGKAKLAKGPIGDFKQALPFLLQEKGRIEADGPPLGEQLLYAFSWETDKGARPVAITIEAGENGRVHAFVRDRVGDRPAWFELPFPKNAKIPARGVSATLEGDVLRIFGGVDKKGNGLDTEWFYDLSRGQRSAFTSESFRVGQNLPDARAWAAAISTDSTTMLAGGVAAFLVQKGKEQKFAATVLGAIEQARERNISWADRQVAPRDLSGAGIVVDGDLAYVGPGASFDGKVDLFDGTTAKWTPLEDLPGGYGLGQLHRSANALFYSGGFTQSKDGSLAPSGKIFALDLEQLDGWKEIGTSPFVQGSTRLVARDDTFVALAVTPKGRMTFVPGIGAKDEDEEEAA